MAVWMPRPNGAVEEADIEDVDAFMLPRQKNPSDKEH
jgi:hypothetical protein